MKVTQPEWTKKGKTVDVKLSTDAWPFRIYGKNFDSIDTWTHEFTEAFLYSELNIYHNICLITHKPFISTRLVSIRYIYQTKVAHVVASLLTRSFLGGEEIEPENFSKIVRSCSLKRAFFEVEKRETYEKSQNLFTKIAIWINQKRLNIKELTQKG